MSRFCDNLYSLLYVNGKENSIGEILHEIEQYLIKLTLDKVPRSISLFQFILAILYENGVVNISEDKFVYHVTPELLSIYPKLSELSYVFNYNE